MTSLRRRLLLRAAKLFDLVLMVFSFGLATVLVAHQTAAASLGQFFSMRIKVANFVIFALLLLGWHIVFSSLGLYGSKRLSSRWKEVFDVMKAATLGSAIVFGAAIFLHIRMVTPLFILIFWATCTFAAAASRVLLRPMLKGMRRHGRNLRHMVVVGTNPRALRFARKIEASPELGYRILGFVDVPWAGMGMFEQTGYPLVADLPGFPRFLREQVVDEVVIALPMESSYGKAARIAMLCEEQGIIVRLLSDLFNLRMAHSRAEEFAGEPVTTLSAGPPDPWPHLCKRTLDVSVSLLAMLILSPLFLLVGLIVKLTSSGPALFFQDRVGLNKRRFRLYKFRTMVVDAERRQRELEHLNEASGAVFKIMNDPRLTPVGKFLRKTSIDELQRPQGRYEPGGPPAASRARLPGVQSGLAAPPLQRPPRHHLPVAGQRPQHRPLRKMDGAGYAVHRSVVAQPRFQNPGQDHSCRNQGRWRRVTCLLATSPPGKTLARSDLIMRKVLSTCNCYFHLALYRGFARHLPSSTMTGGALWRKIRCWVCRPLFSYSGKNLNIEHGVLFPWGKVSIGSNSGIGEHSWVGAGTRIGENVMMGPEVLIYTRNHRTDRVDVPMTEQGFAQIAPVDIGDDVWIGARVIILPGVTVGCGSVLGAGTVISKDVPARAVVVGNPARVVRYRGVFPDVTPN
jgi:acetyltransferase-like isoleucine patch superfamily enzyme